MNRMNRWPGSHRAAVANYEPEGILSASSKFDETKFGSELIPAILDALRGGGNKRILKGCKTFCHS